MIQTRNNDGLNFSFFLWKVYLDTLRRIAFNFSDRFVFPLFFSGVDSDSNLRVRVIYYTELVFFYKKLSEVSCSNVNSVFVIDVFKGYKKGVDYFTSYLEIERK